MITGRVALLAPDKIGFGLIVYVSIEAPDHGAAWRDAFVAVVSQIPEIMEVYRMAGEVDYMLKVAVADMSAFDRLYRHLTDALSLKNVTSHFAMERIKSTTAYPIETAAR